MSSGCCDRICARRRNAISSRGFDHETIVVQYLHGLLRARVACVCIFDQHAERTYEPGCSQHGLDLQQELRAGTTLDRWLRLIETISKQTQMITERETSRWNGERQGPRSSNEVWAVGIQVRRAEVLMMPLRFDQCLESVRGLTDYEVARSRSASCGEWSGTGDRCCALDS